MAYFYEGLTPRDRQFVQLSCGGGFLQKEPEDAIDYLDEIAENSNTWIEPSATESTDRSRPPLLLLVEEFINLRKKIL